MNERFVAGEEGAARCAERRLGVAEGSIATPIQLR